MPVQISMNIGFVTNSSSVVYHFPLEVLEHPKVKAMLAAFEIGDGYVGSDMWNRAACETVAISKEKKQLAKDRLLDHGYDDPESGYVTRVPAVDVDSDDVVVIFGDEYECMAATIADFMFEAMKEIRKTDDWRGGITGDDYN